MNLDLGIGATVEHAIQLDGFVKILTLQSSGQSANRRTQVKPVQPSELPGSLNLAIWSQGLPLRVLLVALHKSLQSSTPDTGRSSSKIPV